MSVTIQDLQKKIVEFRDKRDWKQFHNYKDLAISLQLEASEVLEHFQWKNPDELLQYAATHKKEIGEELADTLYWVLLLAHDLDINLDSAFEEKMKKNDKKYPVEKSRSSHKKYTEL